MEKKCTKNCVVENFHRRSICGQISKKNQLVEKFPKKNFFFGEFPQKIAFLKMSTKLRFVGKLLQKIALLENFQICFVGKFPQKICFVGQFPQKKMQC